jgi:hypothetical protein
LDSYGSERKWTPGLAPQPFLWNLYTETTIHGDKSPGYFRVIPLGWLEFQRLVAARLASEAYERLGGAAEAVKQTNCEKTTKGRGESC